MQDATTYAGGGVPGSRGAEWIHHWLKSRVNLEAGTAPAAAAVAVYVNHGRWVVDCPDCNNAQLACRTDYRFLCNDCGNVVIQGLWRPVVWPLDPAAIEAELDTRPLPNQNWATTQTLADLTAETLVHKEL